MLKSHDVYKSHLITEYVCVCVCASRRYVNGNIDETRFRCTYYYSCYYNYYYCCCSVHIRGKINFTCGYQICFIVEFERTRILPYAHTHTHTHALVIIILYVYIRPRAHIVFFSGNNYSSPRRNSRAPRRRDFLSAFTKYLYTLSRLCNNTVYTRRI